MLKYEFLSSSGLQIRFLLEFIETFSYDLLEAVYWINLFKNSYIVVE